MAKIGSDIYQCPYGLWKQRNSFTLHLLEWILKDYWHTVVGYLSLLPLKYIPSKCESVSKCSSQAKCALPFLRCAQRIRRVLGLALELTLYPAALKGKMQTLIAAGQRSANTRYDSVWTGVRACAHTSVPLRVVCACFRCLLVQAYMSVHGRTIESPGAAAKP